MAVCLYRAAFPKSFRTGFWPYPILIRSSSRPSGLAGHTVPWDGWVGCWVGVPSSERRGCPCRVSVLPPPVLSQRVQQASRPTMDWGPSLEENRTGMYVASLAGSQSPKPLMVHMRKYGGITSYENTAIEVDREMEEEEESMM